MDNKKIALLIDAENVSSKYIKLIMDEVSNYGIATYKRVYGDFQTSSVKAWLKNLQEYAITPVFQYNYTQGKNASDSALIIDAMDILYTGNVDGFCVVTSDSDFTKLVLRLRESGMTVIGMGEQKTPTALVSACESFKFLDILFKNAQKSAQKVEEKKKKKKGGKTNAAAVAETLAEVETEENAIAEPEVSSVNIPDLDEMEKEVIAIIDAAAGDDGWVDLSELGDNLPKRVPGFDPRNYNCTKLRQFIGLFNSIEVRPTKNPHNPMLNVIYIRVKGDEEEEAEAETIVTPVRAEVIEQPSRASEYIMNVPDEEAEEDVDIHYHMMNDYLDYFAPQDETEDVKANDGGFGEEEDSSDVKKAAENVDKAETGNSDSSTEGDEISTEKGNNSVEGDAAIAEDGDSSAENGENQEEIKKKRQHRYYNRSRKSRKAAAKASDTKQQTAKKSQKTSSKPAGRHRAKAAKKESPT